MSYNPDLSYKVTRFQNVTLNNAGNTPLNPLAYGAPIEIRLHKWNKDVRLRKAWITTGSGKIQKDITNYVLPPMDAGDFADLVTSQNQSDACMVGDRTSLSKSQIDDGSMSVYDIEGHYDYGYQDFDKYLIWRIPAGLPFMLPGDPPQLNILHITATEGLYSPVRYQHYGPLSDEHTDADSDGMLYTKNVIDRPGGTQCKFYLYVSSKVDNEVTLDGYSGGQCHAPLIYPIYPKGDHPNRTFKTKRDYTEPRE